MKTTEINKRLFVLFFSLLICPLFLSCIINGWMDDLWARFDKEESDPIPDDPYPGYDIIPVSDLTYTVTGGKITITGYTGDGGKVIIPATIDGFPVTAIEGYPSPNGVFQGKNLTGVVIPPSITSIGQTAFASNELTSITIPNSVTTIGDYAFTDNQLTGVTIPSSVTSIGTRAFAQNQLTSVTISSGVQTIDRDAFLQNQLTSVTFMRSGVMLSPYGFTDNDGNNLKTLYESPPPAGGAGTYTRFEFGMSGMFSNWTKE